VPEGPLLPIAQKKQKGMQKPCDLQAILGRRIDRVVPLLGPGDEAVFFQVPQFVREHPRRDRVQKTQKTIETAGSMEAQGEEDLRVPGAHQWTQGAKSLPKVPLKPSCLAAMGLQEGVTEAPCALQVFEEELEGFFHTEPWLTGRFI
jgi:hypothetical protein